MLIRIFSNKSLLALFLSLCLIFTNQNLQAAGVQDAILRDVQIQQQEARERQNLERQRELEEINRSRQKAIESESQPSSAEFNDDGRCMKIDEFEIEGNEKFKLNKFTKAAKGKCLTKTDLKDLIKSIENHYLKKGYVLARVYLGVENITQGKIKIVVEEGKASNLEIKDNSKINEKLSWRRKLQEFFAFGPYKNKVVNLRDIEQGLDQMNRLSSNNAKLNMTPSDQEGYSDIVINNDVGIISKPSVGISNSGNRNTGRTRQTLVLDQDNLLGINDNIYLSHSRSDHGGVHKKYFKSNYVAISIPFNYYTLGFNYSDSKYLTTTPAGLITTVSSGFSRSSSYYISRVLGRSKKYKTTLKTQMNITRNKNYLEDVFLLNNSRKTAVAQFSLDNVFYTKSGSIFLQPKYNKGTQLLGASKDSPSINRDTGRIQFNSYGLYGSITNNFLLPKTNTNITHNLTFDSQISENQLLGMNQISIGGRYTVRGFEESSISGDNGYYVKNDLTVNSFNVAPKIIKNSFSNSILQKTNLGVFYDYGYIRNNIINDPTDEGHMSGIGAKVNYEGKYFKAELVYSRGLHSPQFVKNVYRISEDSESIYLNLRVGLF
ncbi:MAG: hemolysin activation/secretion protein [Lentimonas sp.]|jgi:hemolysin activation/secretion protein